MQAPDNRAGACIPFAIVPTDWADYQRVHTDRRNLLIHLLAVPLFDAAILLLIFSLVRGNFAWSGIAVIGVALSMLLQKSGHGLEREPPLPFSGAMNFLKRWFREQFVTFPLFVLTGRWWRQFAQAGSVRDAG